MHDEQGTGESRRVFRAGEDDPAATGYFVHVYVDRATRTPVALPEPLRRVLAPLVLTA